MKSTEELRNDAERCRRLASGMSNRSIAEKLVSLAAEFEAEADVKEPEASDQFQAYG